MRSAPFSFQVRTKRGRTGAQIKRDASVKSATPLARVRAYVKDIVSRAGETPYPLVHPYGYELVDIDIDLSKTRVFGMLRRNCPASKANLIRRAAEHLAKAKSMQSRFFTQSMSLLKVYYGFEPLTAADVLRLPHDHFLSRYGPDYAVLPWLPYSLEQRCQVAEMERDNRMIRRGISLHLQGGRYYGPTSIATLEAEAKYLFDIIQAIRGELWQAVPCIVVRHKFVDDTDCSEHGYADAFDLYKGGFVAAAYSALGYETVSAKKIVGPDIHLRGYKGWPHVTSGILDEDLALQIFDRYVYGTL